MPQTEPQLIRLDPTRKAMERHLAELESQLTPPPTNEATKATLEYHVHRLFCGWSAFLRKGADQVEIEEPVVEAMRGVPIWAIEKAVETLHRTPSTKYPPSVGAFRAACNAELAAVRTEAWRLRRELEEMDRPPIDPEVALRRIEAEQEALRVKRTRLGNLFKELSAELRLSGAEHDLTDARAKAEHGDMLPRVPLPIVPEPEPTPEGGARPSHGDHGRRSQKRIAS